MMEKEVLPAVVLPVEVEELALRVSETKKAEVNTVLNQIFAGTSDWKKQAEAIEVKGISDTMSIQLAEVGRKNVKNARLNAEKIFDAKRDEVQQVKAEFDLEDKLWLKAKQTAVILFKDIETTFEWKANFVKRYEAEQKELRTQLRIEKVAKYNPDINRINFENMTDEMFNVFISGMEREHNDKIEAEKKAEAERIETERIDKLGRERIYELRKYAQFQDDIVSVVSMGSMSDEDYDSMRNSFEAKKVAYEAEQERIRLENERLKKEAEERERAAEAERKKQAELLAKERAAAKAKQKAIEAEARKAAEAAEIERKILQAELQVKLDAEIAELKAKEAAELKAKQDAANAAKAPDKDKLLSAIKGLQMELPLCSTKEAERIASEINSKFAAFKMWAEKLIETI